MVSMILNSVVNYMKAIARLQYKMSTHPFVKMWEESSHIRGQFALGLRVPSALREPGSQGWGVIAMV